MQDKVTNDELDIVKIQGKDNPADILTKNVPAEILEKHTRALGVWTNNGRASTAPQLSSIVGDPHGGADESRKEDTVSVIRTHQQPRRALFHFTESE